MFAKVPGPWSANLIKKVQPTSKAHFLEFTSIADAKTMPGVRSAILNWPYREGLRMDEAMHPLTLIVVGLFTLGATIQAAS